MDQYACSNTDVEGVGGQLLPWESHLNLDEPRACSLDVGPQAAAFIACMTDQDEQHPIKSLPCDGAIIIKSLIKLGGLGMPIEC